MPDKVDHAHLVSVSIEDHKIVVVPVVIGTVDNKRRGESGNSAFVLVLFCHATDHVKLLPRVDALRDVRFVCSVFKVVDQQFLPVVVDNIAVEKCYVLRSDCGVDGQVCTV